jgi:hypothetical protein
MSSSHGQQNKGAKPKKTSKQSWRAAYAPNVLHSPARRPNTSEVLLLHLPRACRLPLALPLET